MVHVRDTVHIIGSTQLAVARRHGNVQNCSGSGARDLLWCTGLQPVACKRVVIHEATYVGICRIRQSIIRGPKY